jgi:hypothetical protein
MAIFLCLAMASVLEGGVKTGIKKIWCLMAKDIVPGCPFAGGNGCGLPDDSVFTALCH